MPTTKLIYGAGRIPRASEFALGEVIVNVDDSKVYSKNKNNIVFEIGGSSNTIIEGDTITTTAGFTTASISASGFFTSANTSNLIISGGTGVRVTTGSNNHIIITATGESEATVINAITASYVQIAQSASYVDTSNIYGTLFDLESDGNQGNIVFNTANVNTDSDVSAFAAGLSKTDNAEFAQISSSGNLFASLSLDDTSHFKTVVYNSSSGKFFFTGSYGGGGGGATPTLQQVTSQGSSTTFPITASIISASGDVFVKRLRLSSGQNTSVSGIIFDEQAGNSGFIHDDGQSMHLGYNDTDIITVSSSNDFKLLVNGGARIASGRLQVQGNITASNPNGISNQGNISASGLLFASASQPTHANSIVAVVYDTGSGRFYYTGSYTNLSKGVANRVPFYDTSGDIDTSTNLTFVDNASPGINNGYRQLSVGVGTNGRIRTETGFFTTAITSSVYRHSNNPIQINSDYSRIAFGNNKIDFRAFGEGFDHKGTRMSLTQTELRIGSHSNLVNGNYDELSPVDVIVTGSINTTNYLRLGATGSGTVVSAIAGALFYSASNEFYLGFS
jgi:hypothetical protein